MKVPAGDIKRLSVSSLQGKGGSISLSSDLLQDLIPRRSKVMVTVGPTAAMDVPGILASLDRYPHGCAEQTTSRALPLLYVNDVAKRLGIASDTQIRARVEAAIERVFEMQDASGAFGIWGPSDGDMWLTSYVTDFLTRAKELNYPVRQSSFNQALDRLQNYISYAQDFSSGGESRAYALYVLARNGRAPIGELRYFVDTKLDDFTTPLAQAQLGAALAMMGDKARAEVALKAALKSVQPKDDGLSRRDYGTGIRDGAALITLAAETGIAKPEVPRMIEVVSKAYASRTYTSTQEQAWMLLAARALDEEAKNTTLTVNGQQQQGQLMQSLSAADLQAGAIKIVNTGDNAVDAVVSVVGAALTPEPPVSKGFTIERAYYTHGRQAGGPEERDRRHQPGQAERALRGGGEGVLAGYGRPHPAGRPPAGGPGDREPAHRRLRRHQEPGLAEDHRAARAHRLPRCALRGGLRLLRVEPRAARQQRGERRSVIGGHGRLRGAGGDAGLVRASGGDRGGHVPARPLRAHRIGSPRDHGARVTRQGDAAPDGLG